MLALVLLIPFLCSSLVMSGAMPAVDTEGRVTVILCGSDTPIEMALAADGTVEPISEKNPNQPHQPCIWSSHAQHALNAVQPVVLPSRNSRGQEFALARAALPVLPGPVPPIARGPPVRM
ncbi:hypothetical protein [Paracoccus aestuariivivens]|uniref:DUF2946 domain-containing protein n=1 Tax=Paracoccus aestuariivivens TaxID=1820333 RepID=A0A6L6J4V8_9RHOB|nr:hypothetical protein [Paracoccus aestuariivivens]MTH76278.1 hypothetical protein [Paracoccus aestuariivivens]